MDLRNLSDFRDESIFTRNSHKYKPSYDVNNIKLNLFSDCQTQVICFKIHQKFVDKLYHLFRLTVMKCVILQRKFSC